MGRLTLNVDAPVASATVDLKLLPLFKVTSRWPFWSYMRLHLLDDDAPSSSSPEMIDNDVTRKSKFFESM